MEIRLIRHGKPESGQNPKLNALGFVYWIKAYNASNIASDSLPPEQIHNDIDGHYIVASCLKRAIHSAKLATGNAPDKTLNLLNELEIPRYKLPFNMKAWTWVYVARLLWILGFRGKFESFSAGKKRANEAAEQLMLLAEKNPQVTVFSHGVINIYIRKNLKQNGWREIEKSNGYWGVSHFVKKSRVEATQ